MGKVKRKTYKTTSEHFKVFKDECTYWINYFAIANYRIGFYHVEDESCLGYCHVNNNRSDRIAGLYLSVDFGTDEPTEFQIRKTAFHEVCELMFIGITDNLPDDKKSELVHDVIRRFENTIFYLSYHQRFINVGTKTKRKT